MYYIPVSGEEVQCTTAMAVPSREFLNWSSDGRLVYLTVDGDLVITDLLQGSEELLVALKDRLPINPTWSPESGRIAISVMDQAAENAEDEWASSEGIIPRRIGVVDLASQKLNRLTKGVGFGDELPQWSSDGKYILFARQNEEKVSLWFMRSNGAPVRERGNLGNTSQRKDITIPKKHSTTKGAKFFLRVLCG